MTALSQLPIKIGVEKKTHLYYNKYRYRLKLNHSDCTNALFSKHYNTYDKWRRTVDLSMERDKRNGNTITTPNFLMVKRLYEIYEKNKDSITIRKEYYNISIFSNDLTVLNEFAGGANSRKCVLTKAEASPNGTIYFKKEPNYKFRIYLKAKRVDNESWDTLSNFVSTNTKNGTISISGAFADLLKRNYNYGWGRYLSNTLFIEYNDDSTLSYIGLMFPELVGKTFKCLKKP